MLINIWNVILTVGNFIMIYRQNQSNGPSLPVSPRMSRHASATHWMPAAARPSGPRASPSCVWSAWRCRRTPAARPERRGDTQVQLADAAGCRPRPSRPPRPPPPRTDAWKYRLTAAMTERLRWVAAPRDVSVRSQSSPVRRWALRRDSSSLLCSGKGIPIRPSSPGDIATYRQREAAVNSPFLI